MREAEREEEIYEEEGVVSETTISSSISFTLPPLSFPSALSISPPGDSTKHEEGARAAMMKMEDQEEDRKNMPFLPATTSYSSPLVSSGSHVDGDDEDSSGTMILSPPSMTAATTRTRSSSISSDRTQRALRRSSRQVKSNNASSTISSSSSVNSLTPLASPTASCSFSYYAPVPSSSGTGITTSEEQQQESRSSTAQSYSGSPRLTADSPLSVSVSAVLHQRHHHQHAPQPTEEQQQQQELVGEYTTDDHRESGAGRAALTASSAASNSSSSSSRRRSNSSESHTAAARRSSSLPPLSASTSLPPSTGHSSSDTPTLLFSHDHHTLSRHRQTPTEADSTDYSAYSFIAVTSSSPIRPSPLLWSLSTDSPAAPAATSSPRSSDRLRHHHHYQDNEHNEEAAHDRQLQLSQEQDSNTIKGQSSSSSSSLPLSIHHPSQTFDSTSEHALSPAAQGEDTKSTTSVEIPSLVPFSSSSSSSLSYRIPPLSPTGGSLAAALPESLSKLVIHDLPLSTLSTTDSTYIHSAPVADTSTTEGQDDEEEGTVESPLEIIEDLSTSSPGGIATPPHSRHHHHLPQHHHIRINRLSSSLPASPTQATHAALNEALSSSTSSTSSSSRRLNSLHIPVLRASLDLSTVSSPTSRLPLTPLEEVDSPDMRLDSPADLAELSNPFEARTFVDQFATSNDAQVDTTLDQQQQSTDSTDANETFYHTLLELVSSESGYTADLTDLVEVHFSLLSFARFVTEEQRTIIIRDATRLVDLHRRLQEKLKRVDDDLGWIREDDEDTELLSLPSPSDADELESPISEYGSCAAYTPSSESSSSSRQQQYFAAASTPFSEKSSTKATRRFKSSDATVLDAARRISAIFVNESQNLSDAYRPFCSGHLEAMEVVKVLSSGTMKPEWDAFEAQCTAHLSSRKRRKSSAFPTSSSRLHFADFLIKPVQRICRYPLLFGNLLKNAQKTGLAKASDQVQRYHQRQDSYASTSSGVASALLPSATTDVSKSIDRIREALQTSKVVAAAVDTAQKMRSLEIATVKLARRIEVQSSEHVNLLNRLDQVILIGSAHVIYAHAPTVALQGLPSVLKAGFYGLVLYDSHLVFFKVKKTNVYEPRHWLPLRLFDLQKVADGEGTLPYAFRMVCRDHTFEIGSLCHAEQDIWLEAIEEATAACRNKWLENIASNPLAIDENPVCSVPLDSAAVMFEGVSPIMTSSEFGVFPPVSSEAVRPPISRAGSVLSSNDESLPSNPTSFRPRLSLKPPAQRVGVDLRLADLLSASILSARAQSKRSHAMPLHGPPPRSMTTPSGMPGGMSKRPHSFHPGSFSYRNIIDSTLASRRTSMAESEGSRSSASMKQVIGTANSSANLVSLNSNASEDTLRRKPTKLRRSRTSAQVSDQEATDATTRPQRRNSTLGKLRRRATSLVSDSGPMKALEELRLQEQAEQQVPKAVITISSQNGPVAVAVVAERAILDESVQATVARNSSTSSSSSYASTSTDPSLGNSLETPQSSLPASPLLTPVDLETQSRWTKIGDALAHTLMRKKSFASQRPILAVPPEPLLEGIQLEQAQDAAEFIYTGRHACGSTCSHSGTQSAATSSHSYEKRYSWDRVGWTTLTTSGTATRNAYGSHQRTTSGLSAPPSMNGGASQPNIFGGRSAPNLSSMADKRQASSSSLWSVFGGRHGDGSYAMHGDSSSPAPSIHEDTQDSAESSTYPSPAAHVIALPDIAETSVRTSPASVNNVDTGRIAEEAGRAIPITRVNPLGGGTVTQVTSHPMITPVPSTSSTTFSSPASSSGQSLAPPPPTRSGSLLKRRNSLSARLRAFKTLGSGMTPVRQPQPSRSYVTR